MSKHDKNNKANYSSARIIPVSFLLLILTGTLLLFLPFSTANGERTSFLTALFTSTTSVCVTGLVVVDTFSHWSLFGKIVILLLIQIGGLGVVTVSSATMLAARRKMSLNDRLLLMDAFNLSSLHGLLSFLLKVVKGTFLIEALGALGYMSVFVPRFGISRGIWYSVFTSVSAFCNAGIDILGPDSLIGYRSDAVVLTVTSLLIILGGLGFVVWFDLSSKVMLSVRSKYTPRAFWNRLSEHTKLVLVLTLSLIFGGAMAVFVLEYSNPETLGNLSLGGKILNSFFQSVTFRTAGFAAISQKGLRESTALIGCMLMFIGGSPAGTAGGVKTVTLYIVLKNSYSFIRNRNETVVFSRGVPAALIRQATAIIIVSFSVILLFTVLLTAVSGAALGDSLFEITSAVCTVGLSRNMTPSLNGVGRVIVIISMFLGRIGPITLALFFRARYSEKNSVRYADGKFIIG